MQFFTVPISMTKMEAYGILDMLSFLLFKIIIAITLHVQVLCL